MKEILRQQFQASYKREAFEKNVLRAIFQGKVNEYVILDDKTVLIFLYFEVGLLKLCSTNLISISQERLDLYIDKKITVLKIKDNCAVAVGELQRIFSRAVSYEYRSNRKY